MSESGFLFIGERVKKEEFRKNTEARTKFIILGHNPKQTRNEF